MPADHSRSRPGRSLVRELIWTLLLSASARAQVPGVGLDAGVSLSVGLGSPTIPACLNAVTVTVFPPDYTGLFASLTTLGIPLTTLPPLTLPTSGLESIISGLSPTGSPGASLPLTIPTTVPGLGWSSLLSDIGATLPTSVPAASLSGLPLTTAAALIPSLVQDVVSALVPTSQLPIQTPVLQACPDDNGLVIIENGLPYVLNCNGATTGNVFGARQAAESFNECFAECDQASVVGLANFCTGFTYVGETDGNGPGTCYLQNSVAQSFHAASGFISAAKLLNYMAGGLDPISLPDSTSSIIVSIPGDWTIPTGLPTIGLPSGSLPALPTNLPLTTALPFSDLTNLVPGITSALSGIATNIPLSDLSNILPGLTSPLGPIIPTPTTSDCGLLGLNCVAGPTDRPLTSALAPLPSALSSILAGLECNVASLLAGLGLESGSPVVSSILAGPTQSVCPLLSGLPSAALSTSISLPLTTAPAPIPSTLSSIIAGLPCDVASLLGGLSSSDPIASSILAGPASDICSLLSSLPSALPSVTLPSPGISLPSNLPLTTGLAVSSLLSDLSITPATLPGVPPPTILPSIGPGLPIVSVSFSLGLSATLSVSPPSLTRPAISNTLSITGLPLSSLSLSVGLPTDLSASVPTLTLPTISNSLSVSGVPLPSALSSISVPSVALPTSSALLPSVSLPLSTPSLSVALPSIASLISGGSGTSAGAPASPISSLALPTSTTFPVFSCPSDQGLTYVSSSGQAFSIHCNTDYPLATPLGSSLQPNLFACANSCGLVPGCTGVTYDAATSTCFYKPNTLGRPTDAGLQSSTVSAATPVDLDCPRGDGVYYTDYLGASYQVLCNVTFPASTNVTSALTLDASAGAAVEVRDEKASAAAAAARLEARQFAVVSPQDVPILTCSNRCSNMAGCIAATEQLDQCVFISNLGVSAVGSRIADSVILVGRRVLDASTGGTSTSLVSGAFPTQVQSRQAFGIANGFAATTTTMSELLPSVSLPPVIATPTTSDCGLLSLNCVSGQSPAATPTTSDCGLLGLNCVGGNTGNSQTAPSASTTTSAILPGASSPVSAASGPTQTAATSTDCGLLGLNCVGGNTGGSNPSPTPSVSTSRDCGLLGLNCIGGSANPTPDSSAVISSLPTVPNTSSPASSPTGTLQTVNVSPVPAFSSSSTRDCGLLGLNCIGGSGSTSSSMSTITTRTTSYSQITVTVPVTTITTTSTVSYCNVGLNNFTSCSSSLVVSTATATRASSSSSSSVRPTATATDCGLLGLLCT